MDKYPIGEQEKATLEKLRTSGVMSKISEQRRLVVQVFLAATGPAATSKELLYAAKRLDPMVSKGTVIKVLNAMASAGLLTVIPPQRHPFIVRYAKVAPDLKECSHVHLICKDCGEIISSGARMSAIP